MSSQSDNLNIKTFIATIITLVCVNTVSEVIKRRMPVATVPAALPATPAPARTRNTASVKKTTAHVNKPATSQAKSVKSADSFEKKMAAQSNLRHLRYLPIQIVHN